MRQNGTIPRTDSLLGVRYIKVKCPECRDQIRQWIVLSDCEYVTVLAHCGKRFKVRVWPKGEYEISNIME